MQADFNVDGIFQVRDDCNHRAVTDFVCQLRRHTLHHYGQHDGGLLADPGLQDMLRATVDRFRRT
jgi:hypothetical protein